MPPARALRYAKEHRPKFVQELKDFVRFPSVSSQPKHAADMRKCASWLAGHLRGVGLESVQVAETGKYPIVYGSWLRASGRPTILIYGHYDVLPPDPLGEW